MRTFSDGFDNRSPRVREFGGRRNALCFFAIERRDRRTDLDMDRRPNRLEARRSRHNAILEQLHRTVKQDSGPCRIVRRSSGDATIVGTRKSVCLPGRGVDVPTRIRFALLAARSLRPTGAGPPCAHVRIGEDFFETELTDCPVVDNSGDRRYKSQFETC